MKLILVSAYIVAVVWTAPAPKDLSQRSLPALLHEEVHDAFGQYSLHYITAENTIVSGRGRLVPGKDGALVLEIEGQYQFVGDDGVTYTTSYKGGPDGFYVEGQHLPKSVPVSAVSQL